MFTWCSTLLGLVLVIFAPLGAVAQGVSILQVSFLQSGGQPLVAGSSGALIEAKAVGTDNEGAGGAAGDSVARAGGSLFIDQAGSSLLAPYPMRQRRVVTLVQPVQVARGGSQIAQVRALIGQAEAGAKSYDAIQHGATVLPAKRPTQMSIQEIYDWIADTPGQHHAIGRYQFIPSTLKRLVAKLGVSRYQLFTPRLQDRLGDELLAEAGLHAFGRGEIGRQTFMNNMAKIWAGLPNSTGKSHYDGVAGNRATMTWAHFDREMGRIFPS